MLRRVARAGEVCFMSMKPSLSENVLKTFTTEVVDVIVLPVVFSLGTVGGPRVGVAVGWDRALEPEPLTFQSV